MSLWWIILTGIIAIIIITTTTFWREAWSQLRSAAIQDYNERRDAIYKRSQGPNKGTIVWLMNSYLPNVKAGAEITAHAVNKYLVQQGWRVIICLPDYHVPEIDGVQCIKYDKVTPESNTIFAEADVIFCQNWKPQDAIQILERFRKPIVFFMHIDKEKTDVLQTRFAVPLAVVYNSLTQKEQNPTVHESTIVRPFTPFDNFRRRDRFVQNGPVVLLNCNENKGGKTLIELAKKMRDVQFVGVTGAYSKQINDSLEAPPNLRYIPLQDDPSPIYESAGIVLMPSKSESWGRVALEAMASGVPVIVSKAGGLRESTGGAAADYCRVDDIGCWESAIRRLRGDGGAYRDAVEAGERRIETLKKATDFSEFQEWLLHRIADWKAATEELDDAFTSERPKGWEG